MSTNFSFGTVPFSVPTFPAGTGTAASAPSTTNSDGSFNWFSLIPSTENLVANTFLANQALTSSRASSVTVLPNGTLAVAGGGAGTVGAGASAFTTLFSNPIILIGIILLFILLLKR